MIYLVSACLLGENCKYSGGNNQNQGVLDFCLKAEDGNDWVVPVCPETMGGLSSPRAPSEIQGGDGGDVFAGRARVVSETGEDLTEAFLQGANCFPIAFLPVQSSKSLHTVLLSCRHGV